MSGSTRTVLDFLRLVRSRPGMYVAGADPPGEAELYRLSELLRGYVIALDHNDLTGPTRADFLTSFGDYLSDAYGWSMSLGPVGEIASQARDRKIDPWSLFFRLVDEFEKLVEPASMDPSAP